MERKIVKQLKEWEASRNRKPLILYGARQVGKVYMTDTGLLCSKFGIPANAVFCV
ncbi:MAG: hypothetical protein ACYCYE_14080 [Clostridia bacterium]